MKTAIRNFFSVIRRFKVATVLNIIGLSVAFAAFLVLMMQVLYDWGYDRFHKEADCLYRLELKYTDGNAQVVLSRPLIDAFIASSPHIKEGALINKWDSKRYVSIEQNGQRKGFRELFYKGYPSYAEVFDFKMIEGERSAMNSPEKVLIPESMARRFFENGPAVGQLLTGEGWKSEVGGVYKDFPENSVVENAIYQKIADKEGAGIWGQNNFECYILVDNPANVPGLLSDFENHFQHEQFSWEGKQVRLTNLPDIYYTTDVIFDSQKVKGSHIQVSVLFMIALLTVIIAAINFTNFSNALVPVRLKSVNTQKVLGCSIRTLRFSMLSEAVFLCLFSYGIALLIVFLLSDSSFANTVSGGIHLRGHLSLLAGTILFALVIGIVAGCWPAWHITSFPPATVLKGNFGLSPKGRGIRTVLVGIQFTASFVLIVAALFVSLQNRHMLHTPLGFEKDEIAVVKLNNKLSRDPQLLRQQLTALPDIENVSVVSRVIGSGDDYSTWGRTYLGDEVFIRIVQADSEILNVLGIPLTDGRNFLPEDQLSEGTYIFNEMARKEYNLEAGNTLNLDWEDYHFREKIVGFMPDIKYNSYRNDLEPFGFFVSSKQMTGLMNNLLIRVRAESNYKSLVEQIRKTLTDIDPDYPLEIHLYNEVLENLYQKEIKLGWQISFFGFVAIFISLVGVFGIVLFESEYKKREIGIRKVFGSTVEEILLKLSNPYLRLLCICFVLALPVAYYGIHKWLENFAYKTPMYWWVFLMAFVTVTLITLLTVTIQNWRTANENPINSIKTE